MRNPKANKNPKELQKENPKEFPQKILKACPNKFLKKIHGEFRIPKEIPKKISKKMPKEILNDPKVLHICHTQIREGKKHVAILLCERKI